MKFWFNFSGMQSVFWLACLTFSFANESYPWQSFSGMSVKSHYPNQAVFTELYSLRAVSPYVNSPLELEEAVLRLFQKTFEQQVAEIKILKAKYSLSKSKLLIQGTVGEPDAFFIVDFRAGTIYDPSKGVKTFAEYLEQR